MGLESVLDEVREERQAQDALLVGPEDDDVYREGQWIALLVRHLGLAVDDGAAPPKRFRCQMLMIAALAVGACESWDRLHAPAREDGAGANPRGGVLKGGPMKVFISAPYSHVDTMLHIRAALHAADQLMALGFIPFVPHLTGFWHLVSPRPYEDWLAYDLAWLPCCDLLVRLPGPSPGADREVAAARALGIPVYEGVESLAAAVAFPAEMGGACVP